VSCDPERVTGYVDGELDATERAVIEAHLLGCSVCREQAEAERALRRSVRALPAPEPPAQLEPRIRRELRRGWRSRARVLLPMAAALAALALWLRGSPAFVAWEVALDHAKCFRTERLPAKIFSEDPQRVSAWFEAQGTTVPVLPARAAGLSLVGARYCPLLDGSFAAHVYYAGEKDRASLFVLSHAVRLSDPQTRAALGRSVHLRDSDGPVVAVVSEKREHVDALRRALTTTVARADLPDVADLTGR
jgi:anti-sigma factor RsiW